jgi:RimJ/RimL family protein N-acetyltransferase
MNIPTLETERLILREWRETDFPSYARDCADPDVMRYVGGKTFTTLEAWRSMAYIVGHWALRGYGYFALEEKGTGEYVGRVGVQYPVGWPDFEIGWTISKGRWRRGYALEAARVTLDYAFEAVGRDHVISLIHPENVASIGVATRLGETLEGTDHVMGMDVLVYGISRERWSEGRARVAE